MDLTVSMMALCIGAPLMLALIFLENSHKKIIFFLLMGFLACAASNVISLLIQEGMTSYSEKVFSSYYSPIIEEIMKMLPVLIYIIVTKNKKSDRMIVGMCIGVGFGVLENSFYMTINASKITYMSWVAARGFATALMHALCTAMVAYMLGMAYRHRKMYLTGTIAALAMSITYHSIYNTILKTDYATVILFMPIITYVVVMLIVNRQKIYSFLKKQKRIS